MELPELPETHAEQLRKALRNYTLGYTASRDDVTVLINEIKRLRKKNRLRWVEMRKLRKLFWTAARFETALIKHWFIPEDPARKHVLATRHRAFTDALGPEFARMSRLFDPLDKLEEEYRADLARAREILVLQQPPKNIGEP